MKTIFLVLTIFASSVAFSDDKASPTIAINFSGKGSLLGYDIGVVEQLFRHASHKTPFQKPLLIGNSGGALAAAFFSCFGLNEQTIETARDKLLKHPATMVNDSVKDKRVRLLGATRTEESSVQLVNFLKDFLSDTSRVLCRPRYPVIIIAARGDRLNRRVPGSSILNDRLRGPSVKKNSSSRHVDETSLEVYKTDEAGERGGVIGKACTYFVNPSAYDILQAIPEESRQCDLRKIETGNELLMAVIASASEPLLFYPVIEADYNSPPHDDLSFVHNALSDPYWQRLFYRTLVSREKPFELLPYKAITETLQNAIGGERGYSFIQKRFQSCITTANEREELVSCLMNAHLDLAANQPFYFGGFISTSAAQNIKQALPQLFIVGTGRPPLSSGSSKVMHNWFTADINTIWKRNRWFLDWEAYPFTELTGLSQFSTVTELKDEETIRVKMVAVWEALNQADISHRDESKLEELVQLRKEVSLNLGRVVSLYCMAHDHGGAPDVINPNGEEESEPTAGRRQKARQLNQYLGFNIPMTEIKTQMEKFLSRPEVEKFVTRTTGWKKPEEVPSQE